MNLDLMRLCLVTDRGLSRGRSLVDVVGAAVRGGVTMVQLREKTATTREFLEEARALKALLQPLGIPLIIVMGHERCGAVVAACDIVSKKSKFPGSIGPMAQAIVPAAKAVAGKPGDFVDNAVRESAKMTAAKVAGKSKIVADLVKAGKVKVVAARYDLHAGKVDYLS